MIICNNTATNYKECQDLTLPTWKGQVELYHLEADNFDDHCRNKILALKECMLKHIGEDILYLDTDVVMTRELTYPSDHDLIVTRMVRRERDMPFINAGVFFIRSNERTLKMVDRWLELEQQLRGKAIYPEQEALNQIAYEGYDGLLDITVSNVSENIYNCEQDDTKKLLERAEKYKPALIHLKGGKWKSPVVLEYLRKNGIIK